MGALERERAHLPAGMHERERGDATRARVLGELGVGKRNHRMGIAFARIDDRLALVERLAHRIEGRDEQVGVPIELRRVRHRLNVHRAALE